jgi:hypothetical protein
MEHKTKLQELKALQLESAILSTLMVGLHTLHK